MKFSKFLPYITPYRGVLFLILGLLVAGSFLALLNPWIAGQLTQLLLGAEEGVFPNIPVVLLFWLFLLTLKALQGFAAQYLIGATGETITAELRTRLHDHMQVLPMSYFQAQRPGDTLALLSNDAEVISQFVTDTLVQLLPLLLTFAGAFVMMLLIAPSIAFLALLLLPLYFIAMKIIGRRIRPLSKEWMDSYANMISFVEENLGLIPAIKAFGRERWETGRFERRNSHLLGISKRQLFIESILSPAITFLAGLGLLGLVWLGSLLVESGELSTAELVSLLLYAVLLTSPIGSLANVYGQVQKTRGGAERVLAFLAEQEEPRGEGKPELGPVSGRISFESLSFAYPDGSHVLVDLNFDIEAGETIAITGENGAGKSTLVHLLMRMMDPDKGRILLDDTDIREVSTASLRAQIGLVAQHTLLLNGTVSENIAYGRPLASQEEVVRAARAAHAHEFIMRLPDAYQTVIGDQGLRLSGGQRQRLSLARTLLKDPPVLILDEATSMFDPGGEKGFIEQCHQLLTEKTVILISHRPASLALADRVLALKDGRMVPAELYQPGSQSGSQFDNRSGNQVDNQSG